MRNLRGSSSVLEGQRASGQAGRRALEGSGAGAGRLPGRPSALEVSRGVVRCRAVWRRVSWRQMRSAGPVRHGTGLGWVGYGGVRPLPEGCLRHGAGSVLVAVVERAHHPLLHPAVLAQEVHCPAHGLGHGHQAVAIRRACLTEHAVGRGGISRIAGAGNGAQRCRKKFTESVPFRPPHLPTTLPQCL